MHWTSTAPAPSPAHRDPFLAFTFRVTCKSLTNPRGHTTTATYDAAGNCTQIQAPLAGTVDDFSYNGSGQLTAHLHPANGSGWRRNDTFSYYNGGTQNGYLSDAIADAGGLALTTHYEYDARGNLVRVVDPRGNDTLLTRNQLDEVVRASSPTVNGARNELDFIYDANDNVVRLDVQNRDENGALGTNTHFSRTWSYDFRNFPTQSVEEIDATTTRSSQFGYDGNRNLTLLTLPEAVNGTDRFNIVRFDYDERELPFRTIGAAGAAVQSTTQYDYDANGSVVAHRQGIESAPRVTTFGYDGIDRLTQRTDAAGNFATCTRDGLGNVTHVEITGNAEPLPTLPRLLFAADYSYNAVSRVTSTRLQFFNPVTGALFADGARTTTFARAANQQVTSVTDDNGHTTSFGHDTANRVTQVIDARGNRTELSYDANGNRTAVLLTDKRDTGAADEQFQINSAYDALDRITTTQDNAGNTATVAYDSRGNVTRSTDPGGTVTLSEYDGLSRLTRRVEDMDATGTETAPDISHTYEYDDDSRLTRATDDNNHATLHSYDSLGRPVGTTLADGTQHSRTYDVHNNVVTSQDANGTAIAFTYDALNRLTNKAITPGAGVAGTTTFETFDYDGMGRLLRAVPVNDGSGGLDRVVSFTYDSLGNRRTETTGGLTTSSTYDAVGRRLSLSYPGGRALTYTHDSLDRVTAVNDGALALGAFLYAGRDRLERASYGNGMRLDIAYDGAIGVLGAAGDFGWRKPVFMQHTKVAGGAVIHDLSMLWDRDQNKIARHQLTPFTAGGAMQSRVFDYDDDDRLIHSHVAFSTGPMLDTQYRLDGEGNREQVIGGLNPGVYTRDPATPVPADFQMDQYTATPFDTRQYDKNGNLLITQATAPAGLTRSMSFDYANRLVRVILGGGSQVDYSYDALGRRITKTVQPPGPPIVITTRFAYDGTGVIEERDGGGAVLASFAFDDNFHLVSPFGYCAMRRGGQDYWLHADNSGTVFALTDASGAVVERYDYDDFGEAQFLDAAGAPIPGATQSAAGNPYLFHAARWEPEVRFYNTGGAFYDDQAGRKICAKIDYSLLDWLVGPKRYGPELPPDWVMPGRPDPNPNSDFDPNPLYGPWGPGSDWDWETEDWRELKDTSGAGGGAGSQAEGAYVKG